MAIDISSLVKKGVASAGASPPPAAPQQPKVIGDDKLMDILDDYVAPGEDAAQQAATPAPGAKPNTPNTPATPKKKAAPAPADTSNYTLAAIGARAAKHIETHGWLYTLGGGIDALTKKAWGETDGDPNTASLSDINVLDLAAVKFAYNAHKDETGIVKKLKEVGRRSAREFVAAEVFHATEKFFVKESYVLEIAETIVDHACNKDLDAILGKEDLFRDGSDVSAVFKSYAQSQLSGKNIKEKVINARVTDMFAVYANRVLPVVNALMTKKGDD